MREEWYVVSPFVRRQQLAAALTEAREAAGLTHQQLAARIGQSRQKISRLENGHIRPDQAEIFKLLDVLGVQGDQWAYIAEVANDAADKGWWSSYGDDMKSRQALYADLETGARLIREYQPFIPGLLQIPEFTQQRAQAELDPDLSPTEPRSQRVLEARRTRQRMLLRPGGPAYEVVLDEVAIRRPPAPSEILAAQLQHLVAISTDPDITIRVLPVDAHIRGFRVARSAFSIYTYPRPSDPQVVAVDTVTTDVVLTTLTQAPEVRRYSDLYDVLAQAALSPADSIAYLSTAAEQLTNGAL